MTPGASTQVNLEPFRGTEGVLLTPLTITTKGFPQNVPNEHASTFLFEDDATFTLSNASTPTSIISERFLLESPYGKNPESNLILSLNSPSHEETPSRGTPREKGLNTTGTESGVQLGSSSTVHLWNNDPSPISSSLRDNDQMLWLTSNGTSPKGEGYI